MKTLIVYWAVSIGLLLFATVGVRIREWPTEKEKEP
jgi:hypothetical protein